MHISAFLAAVPLSLSMPLALAQHDEQANSPPSKSPADPAALVDTTPMNTFMMQRMEEMQSHWEKMRQTQDPAERQRLMEEHREQMRQMAK